MRPLEPRQERTHGRAREALRGAEHVFLGERSERAVCHVHVHVHEVTLGMGNLRRFRLVL